MISMSGRREKRRQKGAPMPSASAGLLRFFEEDTAGIRVKPGIVIVMTIALIVMCILAQLAPQ